MGAFIVGGIIGAAAVMILSRNHKLMAAANLNRWVGSAKSTLMNAAMNRMDRAGKNRKEADADLGMVEQIVNRDEELRSQVDQILNEDAKDTQPRH
jgi:hypothetical protein